MVDLFSLVIPKTYHQYLFLFGFLGSLLILPIVFKVIGYFEHEAALVLPAAKKSVAKKLPPRPWWFNWLTVFLTCAVATMVTPHFPQVIKLVLALCLSWAMVLQVLIEVRCRFLADELHYFILLLGCVHGYLYQVPWFWLMAIVVYLIFFGIDKLLTHFGLEHVAAMFSTYLFTSAALWFGFPDFVFVLMSFLGWFVMFNVARFMAFMLYFRNRPGYDVYFKSNLYISPFLYFAWFNLYVFSVNPHVYHLYY